MALSVVQLTSQIKHLAADIGKRARRLRDDRIACGKLLIELRTRFSVARESGSRRGGSTRSGEFCTHLEKHGINVGSAYNWIALAEGRTSPYQNRRNQVSTLVSGIRKSERNHQKVNLLRELVDLLVEMCNVEATVEITEPKTKVKAA